MSFFIFFVIMIYGALKFVMLMSKGNPNVSTYLEENFYAPARELTSKRKVSDSLSESKASSTKSSRMTHVTSRHCSDSGESVVASHTRRSCLTTNAQLKTLISSPHPSLKLKACLSQ